MLLVLPLHVIIPRPMLAVLKNVSCSANISENAYYGNTKLMTKKICQPYFLLSIAKV